MAGMGMSVEKIGHVFGISKATMERRIRDTPGVIEAMNQGRAEAENNVSVTAYELANSGKCPLMTKFWLEVRAGWKAPQVHEHTGKDGASLTLTDIVKMVSKDSKKK